MCNEADVKQLIEDLLGKNYGKKMQAQEKLVACGTTAVEPLIEILKSRTGSKPAATQSFSMPTNMGDLGALQGLFEGMMNARQTFDPVIPEVAMILSQIGDGRAIEPIVATLQSADMISIGLISVCLEKFGKQAIPSLIKALEADAPQMRTGAANALSRIPDVRAVEPLLKLVADPDPNVRQSVTQALGKIRSPAATDSIAERLRNDTSTIVRSWAATALGDLRDEKAADALMYAVLNDPNAETRRLAAHSLRHYRGEKVVQTLIQALHDKEAIVPIWARYALDEMADEARSHLKKLHDEQPEIIEQAYNTWPWEWVEASRGHEHDSIKAELNEMGGTSTVSSEDVKRAYQSQAHDCPICGKKAVDLAWFYFSTPPKTWQDLMGRAGWMTVCDNCHLQVQFFGRVMS